VGHQGPIRCLAIAADGKTVATGGSDHTLRVWETNLGKEICLHAGHREVVEAVAFTPGGTAVAACDRSGRTYLWQANQDKLLREFSAQVYDNPAAALAISRDGKSLALARGRGDVYQWALGTGKLLRQTTIQSPPAKAPGSRPAISALAFAPDGKTLAAGWASGTIRIVATATGKPTLVADDEVIFPLRIAFAPDGKTLAAAGYAVGLWEVGSWKRLRYFKRGVYARAVAYAPNGKTIASAEGGTIRLWNAATGKPLWHVKAHVKSVTSLAFSPDGKALASAADTEAGIRLWRVATGNPIRHIRTGLPPVACVAFSPDGNQLISAEKNLVRCWEASTGSQQRCLKGHKHMVQALALSRDGQWCASGDSGGVVRIWDLATWKELSEFTLLEEGEAGIVTLAFSRDGRTLACGLAIPSDPLTNYSVYLCEVATGQVRRELRGHEGGIRSTAFAPDGKTLVTGSADGTALVWDVLGLAPQPSRDPVGVDPAGLKYHWQALASDQGFKADQAFKAYNSVCTLARAPDQTVPFLRRQLKSIPRVARPQIEQWLVDLGSNRYMVRRKAMDELDRFGEQTEPAVRRLRKGSPSLEVRKRLDSLIEEIDHQASSPKRFRQVRAVEMLEYIGTKEARQVLEALAKGAPEARLTREAQAALARLAK
jgi:WD40 repeat protein